MKQEEQSCSSHHPQNLPVWFFQSKKKKHPLWKQNPPLQMRFLSDGLRQCKDLNEAGYRCLHLQPAPPTSSHLFSPPILGARPLLWVDTQSLSQQPPPSSSIIPGERLRGAVGEVTGSIPALWLFYTCVKGKGLIHFLNAVQ